MKIKYNPFDEALWQNPWPTYQAMREHDPVYYIEELDAWALSRFEDIWQASMDRKHYTTRFGTSPEPLLIDKQLQPKIFLFMDPPQHHIHRNLISDKYAPHNVEQLEQEIRTTTKRLLATYQKQGELDIYQLASKVALHTIADFIGLQYGEIEHIRGLIDTFYRREPGHAGTTAAGHEAFAEVHTYIMSLIRKYRQEPPAAGSHIHAWLNANIDNTPMDEQQLFFSIFAFVITGSDTLPLTTAATLYYLSNHPEQMQAVRDDLSLLPGAFDEAARFDQPTNILGRILDKDITLSGKHLKKGQAVLFLYASANRDENEFEQAEQFSIHRKPNRSLSFGTGLHYCLGQHLARLEGKVILEEVFTSLKDFEVDRTTARRIFGEFLQGFYSLMICFKAQT